MRERRYLAGLVLLLALCACGEEEAGPAVPPAEPPSQPAPPTVPPAAPPTTDAGPWALDPVRGEAQFVEKCQRCHGTKGGGGYGPALNNTVTCGPCGSFHTLWPRIDEFMPLRNPEACDAACSRDIAAWIDNGFSTAPSCSVEFVYDEVSSRRFSATVRILNFRGIHVPAWRLGFTLPADHHVDLVLDASLTTGGQQVLLGSPAGTVLRDGQLLRVTLQGTHPGLAIVPTDLRLEAPPCFTAVPVTASGS